MSQVMRFNMIPAGQPNPSANGLYVRHEDYAALEAELAKLEAGMPRLMQANYDLRQERDAALAECERWKETAAGLDRQNDALADEIAASDAALRESRANDMATMRTLNDVRAECERLRGLLQCCANDLRGVSMTDDLPQRIDAALSAKQTEQEEAN